MSKYLGDFATGATVYVYFDSFSGAGASITLTGLAVTDIEIYKNGSTTQRASDNGYTLLDTDGIDFDGITGIHGFSIDLSDNSDASFYAAGNDYTVVVSSVTIDSQTVSFIAARFSIQNRSSTLLATAAALTIVDDFLDTEIAAIKAKTDNLPAAPAATGDIPSAASIAAAVGAGGDIDGYSRDDAAKLGLAALAGKLSGAATATNTIRAADDSKARITATVDADGNRTAVTLDATG